tara:strand:+ start:199 stop:321 length:123 start_codon:yes stop_codon:yes gene_type:complete
MSKNLKQISLDKVGATLEIKNVQTDCLNNQHLNNNSTYFI